jgi:endonuclease G, mitochondrial
MKKLLDLTLPGTESRIATVLKSKEMRSELAERAGKHELASTREMAFSSDVIADHLSGRHSPTDDTEFFDTRRVSEAIVLIKGRPVLFVRNGVIEQAELDTVEAMLKGIREAMVKPISAVGRIELSDHDTYEWCGTGWRTDEDLIVTNRHVANIFVQRQDRIFKFRLNQMGKQVRARIDFREEYKGMESEEFGIAEILWIAEDTSDSPDVAILQVRKDPGLPPPLSLASKNVDPGQLIGVVGYPARDGRNDPLVMSDVYNNIYDVKRFAPGEVVWPGEDTWYITHDASTLGGNSGSAVIDLASQEVVGLHFGGSFRKTNYAVKASVIKSILARRSWIAVTPESLSIPSEAFTEKKRTIASMENRGGYDKRFLGKTVALPKIGNSHAVLKTNLPGDLLPYEHFSILMSESRRFSIYTAENLDGELKIKLKRRDSWGFDPRIPESAQVGHADFYGPEPFDKGHMVRRENAGWGQTEEEAQLGEDDTFVYTNAIPQMPQLNQQTWLSLENYVLDNAKTEGFKICVFTGPVYRPDDPSYSNIQVPTDFWKIVVAIDASTKQLLVSAYLLSQEGLMPEEGFRYGPFKTYQVPVRRIEKLADLKFSKSLRSADVFSDEEITEMFATSRYVEINSADDIVLTSART